MTGMFKSLWRLLFVKYQGEDVTKRMQIDWNVWSELVLGWFIEPYNRIRPVTSQIIYLYIVSSLGRESLDFKNGLKW